MDKDWRYHPRAVERKSRRGLLIRLDKRTALKLSVSILFNLASLALKVYDIIFRSR